MARPLKKRIGDWMALHVGIPIAYAMFRLICMTLRHRSEGPDAAYFETMADGRGHVAAFWHGDAFLMAQEMFRVYDYGRMFIMASASRDGALMARFLQLGGVHVIRGSSSRGGARAMREVMREYRPPDVFAMAVDGPRGPRHCIPKAGIVLAAQRLGLPITAFVCHAEKKWVIRSWDRMEIPKPFSRTRTIYSDPIPVPPDASPEEIERIRAQLEETLREMKGERP